MTTTTSPKRTPKPTLPDMATEGQVRHIYRASVKLGEDFRTLECEITVPIGASDDLIREAQDTARRVRLAQAEATERDIEALREDAQLAGGTRSSRYTIRDPEVPASTKQRNAIERLAVSKGWDTARLVDFCDLAGTPLLTITKGGASWLIDALTNAPALPATGASFAPAAAPLPAQDAAEPPLPFTPEVGDTGNATSDPDQDIPF
jgi:hypothetical protein